MRIMGISPIHDSSVAIINDGALEVFFKEERLSGKKRDKLPFKSIFTALNCAKGPIDYVAICSPDSTHQYNQFLEVLLGKLLGCEIIHYSHEHHFCHANLAFYNSGFSTALTVVIDRNGSQTNHLREAESVFICNYPNTFEPIYKSFWLYNTGADADSATLKSIETIRKNLPKDCEVVADTTMSIVKVYESATTLIGQDPLENGKTMGLSAYGNIENNSSPLFFNGRPIDSLFCHDNFIFEDYTTTLMREHLGKIVKEIDKDEYKIYADHALRVQLETQNTVLELIKRLVEKTKIKNVCITGGYGLNVVANNFYTTQLSDVNFYFEPNADDTGNSIGAAMAVYREKSKDLEIKNIKDLFYHGVPQDLNSIEGEFATEKDIVNFLKDQKIVAVFNGLAEGGPRALGNRSILFDSRNINGVNIINKIKKREWYRPFAGMVLKEDAAEYFDMGSLIESQYMTMCFPVKCPEKIPGVTHVDNTCRVQTVDNKIPHIHNLLNEFKNATGCSVLLNTSFNLAGLPLVETVQDAINTFNSADIDVLWFPEIQKIITK
jgi:carbamoyltransferase